MKQFFCVLVMLLACAGLLFLVSAPVNSVHGSSEEHSVTEQAGEHGEVTHETPAGHAAAEK